MANKIYLSLGSNLGSREKNLETALQEISNFAKILKKSSIHETEPVGYENQPKFLNMAIEIETDLSALESIIKFQEIEHKMGRVKTIKNGPRIIDLDILFYNDKIIDHPSLKVPHPRLHTRNFVLNPLKEIAANHLHPQLKKDIRTLHQELPKL